MAFQKATIVIRSATVGTGLKATLRRTKKAAANLTIFLSGEAARTFALADKDKMEVLIGDGEHHGLIRLRKNNSAGQATAVHKDTGKGIFFTVRLGHQPAFVDRSEPGLWCQWEAVEDGWFEIVLPRWADETGPNKQRVAAPPTAPSQPVVERRPIGRPRKDVTSTIMGDPSPDRRALLRQMGEMKP